MKTLSRNTQSALALLAFSFAGSAGMNAETIQAGNGTEHQDVCSAIAAAKPGDTIEVSGPATSSYCAWTTSNLTIKGVGTRPLITVETGVSAWSIAAEDTVIENLSFAGSRCAKGECVALELHNGNLAVRNVSISGSDIGIRAHNSAGGALTIERSEVAGNRSNIDVERIARFALSTSYVHDAVGGVLVRTAALENSIQNNRLASGPEASASGELVIAGSTKTDLSGNVLVRANGGSTAGLIQYVDLGHRGEVVAQRNTFVNATTSGIEFIESIGSEAPSLRIEGNVFWGDTSADQPVHAAAAASNYFGFDDVFRSDNDFRLNGRFVPPDMGAVSGDDIGFPLNVASRDDVSSAPVKGGLRNAVGAATVASITLTSSDVGGAKYVFSNKFCLTQPAPAGGVVVYFTSSNTAVLTLLNPTVTVAGGATCGTFGFRTYVTATATLVTITATANGGAKYATVKVGPVAISRVTMGDTEIGSNGTITTNRVELNGPAPAGGMVITLKSSCDKVTAPATVTIPAGITSNAFSIKAGLVLAETKAVITASHSTGSKPGGSIDVLPVAVKDLLVTPTSTSGGVNVLVKVYLNGPAPDGGLSVTLQSSKATVLPLPTTITVPAGQIELGILSKLSWVSLNTPVTVTANSSYGSATDSMTAIPTQMAGIIPSANTVKGGTNVTLSLRLTGPAPSGGITVSLSSSASGTLAVPTSVFVSGGTSTLSVVGKAGAVTASTPVTIKAAGGGATTSVALTVAP